MDGYDYGNTTANPTDRIVDELEKLNSSFNRLGSKLVGMFRPNRSTRAPFRGADRGANYTDKLLDFLRVNQDQVNELVDNNTEIKRDVRGLLQLFTEDYIEWEDKKFKKLKELEEDSEKMTQETSEMKRSIGSLGNSLAQSIASSVEGIYRASVLPEIKGIAAGLLSFHVDTSRNAREIIKNQRAKTDVYEDPKQLAQAMKAMIRESNYMIDSNDIKAASDHFNSEGYTLSDMRKIMVNVGGKKMSLAQFEAGNNGLPFDGDRFSEAMKTGNYQAYVNTRAVDMNMMKLKGVSDNDRSRVNSYANALNYSGEKDPTAARDQTRAILMSALVGKTDAQSEAVVSFINSISSMNSIDSLTPLMGYSKSMKELFNLSQKNGNGLQGIDQARKTELAIKALEELRQFYSSAKGSTAVLVESLGAAGLGEDQLKMLASAGPVAPNAKIYNELMDTNKGQSRINEMVAHSRDTESPIGRGVMKWLDQHAPWVSNGLGAVGDALATPGLGNVLGPALGMTFVSGGGKALGLIGKGLGKLFGFGGSAAEAASGAAGAASGASKFAKGSGILSLISMAIDGGLGAFNADKALGDSGKGLGGRVSGFLGGALGGGRKGTLGNIFGGALKGAGVGAAAGAGFLGIGALPGAIGGAVLGAVTSAFGSDKLTKAFYGFGEGFKNAMVSGGLIVADMFSEAWDGLAFTATRANNDLKWVITDLVPAVFDRVVKNLVETFMVFKAAGGVLINGLQLGAEYINNAMAKGYLVLAQGLHDLLDPVLSKIPIVNDIWKGINVSGHAQDVVDKSNARLGSLKEALDSDLKYLSGAYSKERLGDSVEKSLARRAKMVEVDKANYMKSGRKKSRLQAYNEEKIAKFGVDKNGNPRYMKDLPEADARRAQAREEATSQSVQSTAQSTQQATTQLDQLLSDNKSSSSSQLVKQDAMISSLNQLQSLNSTSNQNSASISKTLDSINSTVRMMYQASLTSSMIINTGFNGGIQTTLLPTS